MRKKPGYLRLHEDGRLEERIAIAQESLHHCQVCPHKCGVDRRAGELGLCQTGSLARVASFGPHFGEESPLVGINGSGTLFFEGCNLLCVFCQNYDISHIDDQGDNSADGIDSRGLAEIMINLQDQGCHNINFVTPSHVVPQILSALPFAIKKGLRVPLVYNSGGYDSIHTLKLLDGVIDIYMPDCKFWLETTGKRLTKAGNYPGVMRRALREMYHQVGDLDMAENGIATRGLLVRHLVMPNHLQETREILDFLAEDISANTYVNIMDQYRPCGHAHRFSDIDRSLDPAEYHQALKYAQEFGLHRLDKRDMATLLQRLGL